MTAPPFNTKYCGRIVVGMIGRERGREGGREKVCVSNMSYEKERGGREKGKR